MLELGVRKYLIHAIDWAARHTCLVQHADQFGARTLLCHFRDRLIERDPVAGTARVVSKTRILQQMHHLKRLTKSGEDMLSGRRDIDVTIQRREHAGGYAGGMVVSRL